MRLHGQIKQGAMIHQHTSALAIKVRAPLFDGQKDSKQFKFVDWVVTGGASQLFTIIGDWL